jgi:MoxR-like ATPase
MDEQGSPPSPPSPPQTAGSAAADPVVQACELLGRVRSELGKLFIGQHELVEQVLTALVAGGHILVESVPGLGKTLLVKAIGKILGLETGRIQFTPDLMPSDITGSHVFDMGERRFVFHRGPVFTQFLLADEFNRAPAKTHAALLEVMQEQHVTLDGTCYRLAPPFLVMATQNPIENEGTYTLPEAQLDRFLIKVVLPYPDQADEERILGLFLAGTSPEQILADTVQPVATPERLLELQALAARLTVQQPVLRFITEIVRTTRGFPGLHLGASPRAGIAILTSSRALALTRGRSYVVPDDVVDVVVPAMRHRVILSPEAEVEGRSADSILRELLSQIDVPRGITAPAAVR